MTHYRLALVGFGNVGRAFVRLLERKKTELASQYSLTFSVTAIASGRHGAAINPQGIDSQQALQILESGGSLNQLSTRSFPQEMTAFIRSCPADVLFENTPVNYKTGQPAIDHLRAALLSGMHAITANKGPVVHAYHELRALAQTHGKRFFFESTVMDGAPIFSLFRGALPAARLVAFRGILNSTTNLILSRMENGESFDEAVRYAQSIGIAETDPAGDIDGWDAAVKIAALVTVLMDTPFQPQQVKRTGIRAITPAIAQAALKEGERWKLVCAARRNEAGEIQARVAPEKVGRTSPLYTVDGTTSIVEFETDVLEKLSIIEADPGPSTTAYGLLADFIQATR